MAGTISTITGGILTGRLHRGVNADPMPDYVIPGAGSLTPSLVGVTFTINPGSCVIGGCIVDFPASEEITISPVAGQIGFIVARLNLTDGTATLMPIQGTDPVLEDDEFTNSDTGVRDFPIVRYVTSSSAVTEWITVRPIGTTAVDYLYSDAPAGTNDKGNFTGYIPMFGRLKMEFGYGNTAASPYIRLNGRVCSIYGIPTVAQVTSAPQTYVITRGSSNIFSATTNEDYITECGVTGDLNAWHYKRFADGTCHAWGGITVTISSSGSFGTGGLYLLNGTFPIPAGLFNARPSLFAGHPAASSVYGSAMGYTTSSTQGGVQIIKSNSTSTTITESVFAVGTWK